MMAYPYYGYGFQGFQPNFNQPASDQLQQLRQPYQQQMQVQQAQSNDERIWVQGLESAKAYLIAPNGFVRLWDSSSNVFYEKHADATGRPYMEIYEYTRKSGDAPQPTNEYMTRIKELETRIEALEKRGIAYEPKQQSNADDTAVPSV